MENGVPPLVCGVFSLPILFLFHLFSLTFGLLVRVKDLSAMIEEILGKDKEDSELHAEDLQVMLSFLIRVFWHKELSLLRNASRSFCNMPYNTLDEFNKGYRKAIIDFKQEAELILSEAVKSERIKATVLSNKVMNFTIMQIDKNGSMSVNDLDEEIVSKLENLGLIEFLGEVVQLSLRGQILVKEL